MGLFCPFDITLLQTSKDRTDYGSSVKINPFDAEKGQLIKDSFNLGKLDWATVVIVTEPPSPEWEQKALTNIRLLKAQERISKAMLQCAKVNPPIL